MPSPEDDGDEPILKAEKTEKDKGEKSDKPERSDKGEKSDKPERSDKFEKSEKDKDKTEHPTVRKTDFVRPLDESKPKPLVDNESLNSDSIKANSNGTEIHPRTKADSVKPAFPPIENPTGTEAPSRTKPAFPPIENPTGTEVPPRIKPVSESIRSVETYAAQADAFFLDMFQTMTKSVQEAVASPGPTASDEWQLMQIAERGNDTVKCIQIIHEWRKPASLRNKELIDANAAHLIGRLGLMATKERDSALAVIQKLRKMLQSFLTKNPTPPPPSSVGSYPSVQRFSVSSVAPPVAARPHGFSTTIRSSFGVR